MKNIILGILVLVIIGGFVWKNDSSSVQEDNTVLKIGAALALTGDCADFGASEKEMADLLIDKYNQTSKIKINVIYEDTHCDDKGTVTAINKLISIDKVQLIYGPTWGDSYQGANTIAERAGVLLLTPSAALESVSNKKDLTYLFSTWPPLKNEMARLVGFMKKKEYKKIAIVSDLDPYDTTAVKYFKDEAIEQGYEKNNIESYILPVGLKDFRTTVIKIRSQKPDVIFISLNQISTYGVFLQQLHEFGLSIPAVSNASTQNEPLIEKFGSVVEGLTYTFPKDPTGDRYDQLVSDYKERYGRPPLGPSVLSSANAVAMIIAAVDKGMKTGVDFKTFMQTGFAHGYGIDKVSFNEKGQIDTADFQIKMIKDGKFIVVE